jgi:hypothetical protein
MSWSVSLAGNPAKVVAALEAESAKQTGQCKIEFDDALPHLVGLVNQNFQNREGDQYPQPSITLEACGSGSSQDGKQLNRDIQVTLKRSAHKIV